MAHTRCEGMRRNGYEQLSTVSSIRDWIFTSGVPNTGTPGGKNTHTYRGSVSIVSLPEPSELAAYSAQVAENNGWNHRSDPPDQPQPFTAKHPIEHVIYVIKENRTYDQVLADDPRGNRDVSLLQFGAMVTPNQHAPAQQFALFDNFYDSGCACARRPSRYWWPVAAPCR
jgi:hypothetical protein